MARTAGTVQNKHTAKNVRRKSTMSEITTITNGSTANLVLPLLNTPPNSRVAVESLTIIPIATGAAGDAAWNSTIGSIAVGHSTADGTFDDDSILDQTALPTANAKVLTVKTTSNFVSTLKTGSKAVQNVKYPIVPSNSTVWSTATATSANGTGTFAFVLRYWELDDENE